MKRQFGAGCGEVALGSDLFAAPLWPV